MEKQNIFHNLPLCLPDECVELLKLHSTIRIERIISKGHSTPVDEWYDQTENEWVIVLQGFGVIEYENGEQITLNVGDYLFLPAHLKHRVTFTSKYEQTIWLAIFWS